MWPIRFEMTRDECRKCLRCLELDAYGSMVSVLRAQGPFTNEKQKLLQELAKVLHISNERHRAEIRRAVNDEKLATIAEQLNGPNTGTDWTIEGRRTIPLLPRLKARSVFTTLANSLSLATAAANEKEPKPVTLENTTATETESQPELKVEKDLSDAKSCSLENDCGNKILHENSNSAEEEEIANKDVINEIIEKPIILKRAEKRKSPSPLPIEPPKKIQVVWEPLNNSVCTTENKQASQTAPKQLIPIIKQTPKEVILLNTIGEISETNPDTKSTMESGYSKMVQVVSEPLNNSFCTTENKQAPQTAPKQLTPIIKQTSNEIILLNPIGEVSETNPDAKSTMGSGHFSTQAGVSLNKSAITTAISNIDWANFNFTKLYSNVQNNVSTKVVPAVSSVVLSTSLSNKVHSESKDSQSKEDSTNNTQKSSEKSENTSSNSSCKSRLMASIIHDALVSSSQVQITPVVYPSTTVSVALSGGPGSPQVKQASTTVTCKKLPSEQIAINHQSTAKTGATINSKKVVNMSQYRNAKLNTKTNVIVIQKAHAQGVTLSHAGKEVLGKVIMGGKNLCVTSQHNNNANSISVQSHHISLNNGDQTKTTLPTVNSPQNAESAYTNINFKQVVDVSANLRHDSNKNKLFSQFLEKATKLHVQHKTVIQNANVQQNECGIANTTDRDSFPKADSALTDSATEEKHRINKNVNASVNCQAVKSLDSSKSQESKEIFIRPKQIANMQDDISNNIQIENSDEDVETIDETIDDITNPQHVEYILQEDNYKNCVLEDSRSIATVNQLSEHDDS